MCKTIKKVLTYTMLSLIVLTIGVQVGIKIQRDRSNVTIGSLNEQIDTLVKTIHYNNGE